MSTSMPDVPTTATFTTPPAPAWAVAHQLHGDPGDNKAAVVFHALDHSVTSTNGPVEVSLYVAEYFTIQRDGSTMIEREQPVITVGAAEFRLGHVRELIQTLTDFADIATTDQRRVDGAA